MKLTVAIPTYKRPQLLARCIESVLDSIGEREVELLVLDDSTDRTNDAVYARLEGDRRFRLVRNDRNLGIDRNICACIEHATGGHVWLIGEDDLMRRTGVPAVLEKLSTMPEAPFVFVNYSYITADQCSELRHRSIDEDNGELPFETFADLHLWSTGFIGGCVIHRGRFLATDYRSYIGTYFAHVAGLTLASLGGKVGIVSEPQIGNRVGNAETFTWATDSFGVFQGWRVLLGRMRTTFGEARYQRAYDSHVKAHGYLGYKFLIGKKADNLLTPDNIRMLQSSDVSSSEIARVRAVAYLFPAAACRWLRSAYAALRRRRLPTFSLG